MRTNIVVSGSRINLKTMSVRPLMCHLIYAGNVVIGSVNRHHRRINQRTGTIRSDFTLCSSRAVRTRSGTFLLGLHSAAVTTVSRDEFSRIINHLRRSVTMPVANGIRSIIRLATRDCNVGTRRRRNVLGCLVRNNSLSLCNLSGTIAHTSRSIISCSHTAALRNVN